MIKYKMIKWLYILCVIFSVLYAHNNASAQAPGSSPASVGGQFEDTITIGSNVCPEPKSALSNTPNDLAKIQSDITRFSLCVKRAQLLERLNELVSSSIETIDSAIEYNISPSMDNLMANTMQNIPMPQAPSFDNVNINDNVGLVIASNTPSSSWNVRDISGKNGTLSAMLVNNDGVLINVKHHEKLPDDAGVVSSLSVSGVKIKKDGKITTLKWAE